MDDFNPAIGFGSRVRINSLLGTGTLTKILEEYDITSKSQLLVEDGEFVKKKTPLLKIPGAFNEVFVISDHSGLVKITKNKLQIIDLIPNYKYKSPVKGQVKLVTPNEILIEAEFYKIPLLATKGPKKEGYIYVIYSPSQMSKLPLQKLQKKIVIYTYSPTKKNLQKILSSQAKGMVVPSIPYSHYNDFLSLGTRMTIAVLQSFGTSQLWSIYKTLFAKLHMTYAILESTKASLLTAPKTVSIDKNKIFVFKDLHWGTERNLILDSKKNHLDSFKDVKANIHEISAII